MVVWAWIRAIFVSPGVLPVKHMKKVKFSSLSDENKRIISGSLPHGTQTQEQAEVDNQNQRQPASREGPTPAVEDPTHTTIETNTVTAMATPLETHNDTQSSSRSSAAPPSEVAHSALAVSTRESNEHTDRITSSSGLRAVDAAPAESFAGASTNIQHTQIPTGSNTTHTLSLNTEAGTSQRPVLSENTESHRPPSIVAPLSTPLSGNLLATVQPPQRTAKEIERMECKVTFRIPASEMKLNERGMLMCLKADENVRCPVRTITAERGGGVRLCRVEKLVKPDRTHHCSICRRCVLRYDHHCPWIHNCVGFRNYKFFYLFLLYMFLLCWWTFGTTLPYTIEWFQSGDLGETKNGTYPLSFSLTIIGALFGVMVSGLFFFHTYLICVNKTTVEQNFLPNFTVSSKRSNAFNLGVYNNWKYIMGANVWLWFVPVDGGRSGDGLAYPLPEPKVLA